MALFNILVDIAARTASFESGIQRVEKRLDSFAAGAQKLAGRASSLLGVALGFETLRSSIVERIARGDELDRLAERMQTTAENLSQLEYVARQSDIAFNTLTSSIDTYSKNVGMAAIGTGRAQKALRQLNIDAAELVKLPLDRQLDLIADAIAAIEDPARQSALTVQLFGSADMLSALRNGSAGIQRLREESDKLGFTIDSLGAKKLAAADTAIKNLNSAFTGLGNTLATTVAPSLTTIVNGLNQLITGDLSKNLSTQLSELAEERNRLLANLRRRESDFGRFLLGRRADSAIENTRKELEAIERGMARVNDQMIALQKQAAAGPITPGSDGKENAVFARQINYYNSLWMELKGNYEYLEQLEQRRNERIAAHVRARGDLESLLERGITSGMQEIERRGEQTINAVSEIWDRAITKTQELSTYAEQAARNMQSDFAEFLFDPFNDGLKGMLKGFVDTIRRMLAEATAAKVFEALFGKDGSGGNGSNAAGWFDALLGSFGGGKAGGGPLQSGKWYVAGEHGPEPIWGGGAGAFAMGYGGGGGNVTVNMPVDMRGATVDAVRLFEARSPMLIRQAADLAKAEMRNDRRRGKP